MPGRLAVLANQLLVYQRELSGCEHEPRLAEPGKKECLGAILGEHRLREEAERPGESRREPGNVAPLFTASPQVTPLTPTLARS